MNFAMNPEYPYLYETHCHTKESSACGVSGALEMAKAHKDAGYAGMIITNHNWGGNTCIDISKSWCDWLDEFFNPYFIAKEWGDRNDFQVFYGYEAGYEGTEFLIYGLTIEYMKKHPELKTASIKEQLHIVHEGGGIVIHAHPYREASFIPEIRLFPDLVDGVEAINAMHSSPYRKSKHYIEEYNDKAINYAQEHDFTVTAGSDTHDVNLIGGGTAFRTRLESIEDFCNRIIKGEGYAITDGSLWLDGKGRRIK